MLKVPAGVHSQLQVREYANARRSCCRAVLFEFARTNNATD